MILKEKFVLILPFAITRGHRIVLVYKVFDTAFRSVVNWVAILTDGYLNSFGWIQQGLGRFAGPGVFMALSNCYPGSLKYREQ